VHSGSCELERETTPNSLEVHQRVSLNPIYILALGFSGLEAISLEANFLACYSQ
jgi:hypothetical protein